MGRMFRVFDFQNGKIISDIPTTEAVCLILRALSEYSTNLGVSHHGDDTFCTRDFKQDSGSKFFIFSPEKKEDCRE